MERIKIVFTNIKDFINLLRPYDFVKSKEGINILIFNWRDRKHVWAGGAEVYVDEISRRWAQDGNTVAIFCGNDGQSRRDEVVNNVRIIRRGGFYTVYVWAFLYYLLKFRGKFDVIIDSENGIPFFTPLFSRVPVVLLIHHVHQEIFIEQLKFPFSYIARFIEGKLMPFVYKNKMVITVSESSKKEIIKFGIAKESQIKIVNPGINFTTHKFRKTGYPSIVYLGRLKAYKNIDIAIRAFSYLFKNMKKSRLDIVGEGDSFDELRDLTVRLGIERAVTFHGRVSEQKKREILAKSWIAVQPSRVEGWGITVLEANSCGTPVIASNTNGLRDSVVDGKTGILVKLRDTKELTKTMKKIIKDSALRKQLSQEAYRWSLRYQWELSAKSFYDAMYSQLTAKKPILASGRAYIERLTSLF